MASNWRNDQDRYGYPEDDRDRWRSEGGSRDYERGGRQGEYRGGGYGNEGRGFGGGGFGGAGYGQGRRSGEDWGGEGYGRGYGGDDRSRMGGFGQDDRWGYGGGYGDYRGGSGGGGFGRGDWGRGDYGGDVGRGSGRFREGRFGGENYGRESYGRGSAEYGRQGEERGFWDRASDEVSSWFGDQDAERRRREDMRGEHRGRGPKNYTRSDDRIREDVNDRLSDDPFVDATNIEVQVSQCEVTLSGHVDSREAKRRAEDCAERVSGVKHVQNNLRVQEQGAMAGMSTQPTGAQTTTGTRTAAGTQATGTATTGSRQKA